jgi:Na+-driven multidrug efflux pump
MTAAVAIAAKPLVSIITPDASLAADSVPMLCWQVAGSAFGGIVMLLTCLFQASGKAAPAMALSLSRQGILFIAVLFIAVRIAGYKGILVSQCAADVLSAVLALELYRLCFRKQGG